MPKRSVTLRLDDMIEAASRIREVLGELSLEAFEADWQWHGLVQRGIEIISEASRHLPPEMKARHPDIPWTKVAGIGNVLRHGYEDVGAPVLWKLVREDLLHLERACRAERTEAQDEGGHGIDQTGDAYC
jgi:uncharacterized protein with HEPN domain